MKNIYLIIFISALISCEVNKYPVSSKQDTNTSLSLLDRLRSIPGLKISGFDERNAEVYLRGQTSILYYNNFIARNFIYFFTYY